MKDLWLVIAPGKEGPIPSIARKVHGKQYHPQETRQIWSEYPSTAMICYVGMEIFAMRIIHIIERSGK